MKNKLLVLGEAWGVEEERERTAFVGTTGWELNKLLAEAGIHRADCYLTNVFNLHPPSNRIEAFCGSKDQGIPGFPALVKGKYVRREFAPELDRLGMELLDINPNLVLALGNTAVWAVCGKTAVSKIRGTTSLSTHTASGYKVLPTYHPAAIFRQWELRPTLVIDLMKAEREQHFPEIRRPQREIWIEPTLEDLELFYAEHIVGCRILSVDIENPGGPITEIGFAPSKHLALVIPFVDKKGKRYWPSLEVELKVWGFCKRILEDIDIKKVMQNGLYDVAVLWRMYGIRTRGFDEDSMLLHHALQPESLKGLGFLGSIYTDEGSWKQMRQSASTLKRDD